MYEVHRRKSALDAPSRAYRRWFDAPFLLERPDIDAHAAGAKTLNFYGGGTIVRGALARQPETGVAAGFSVSIGRLE